MNSLLSPLLKLGLPTLARHLLASAAGFLAVTPGAGLMEYVVAVTVMILTWVWSFIERGEVSPDAKAMIANLGRALASQAMAFLSGVLVQNGYAGDVNDPVGVLVFAGNLAHSMSVRRKVGEVSSDQVSGVKSEARKTLFRR